MEYEQIVEGWVRDFVATMDNGVLDAGNRSGDEPFGVKIIFDGYGYNEETDEDDNYQMMSFAVFVHKNSLEQEFPEHDFTPWGLIHRPDEEVCIWVWYDLEEDRVEVIPFEENNSTKLDNNLIYSIIKSISER